MLRTDAHICGSDVAVQLVTGLVFTLLVSVAPPATIVKVGTHVVAMRNIDTRAQSFYADFYLWLRFAAADEARDKLIIDNLEPVNGKFESKDEVDRKLVNGEWYVCFRVTGTFFFDQDLRLYPFDRQTLELSFENSRMETGEMVFADDKDSYAQSGEPEKYWGINHAVSIPEFKLSHVTRTMAEASYPTNFGDPERKKTGSRYSRYVLRAAFDREYLSYAFKILIPLLIILAMAYLVFYLPPDQLDTAAAVAVTALLSCMAYNVAVSQNMPDIGYLVLSDKFFIASYALLFLTLAETFAAFVMTERDQAAAAIALSKRARWVFPLLVALIFVWLGATAAFV